MRLVILPSTLLFTLVILTLLLPLTCLGGQSITLGGYDFELGMSRETAVDALKSFHLREEPQDYLYAYKTEPSRDPSEQESGLLAFNNNKLIRIDKLYQRFNVCDTVPAIKCLLSILSHINEMGFHKAEINTKIYNYQGMDYHYINMGFSPYFIRLALVSSKGGGTITIAEGMMEPELYDSVFGNPRGDESEKKGLEK